MTTASPSEFLTFMRHIAVRSSIRPQTYHARPRILIPAAQPAVVRSLHTSPKNFSDGKSTDRTQQASKQHATTKEDQLDVQSDSVGSGKGARAAGGEDNTTAQSDTTNSTAKAKKDHPEAPDVVIGMQDERGGKGH